jgi:Domain of unknown function (DUF4832)
VTGIPAVARKDGFHGELLLTNSVLRIAAVGCCLLSTGLNARVAEPPASEPQCETKGTRELTISCSYAVTATASRESTEPRIALVRAVISFEPWKESHMHVELTFTNDSNAETIEKRTIYLAFDDAKGQNHMRRPLPHVDFTKLEPGKPMTFEETLRAPAFEAGSYSISLWIPSNDAALKFNRAHNFLLSNEGVPDPESGVNRIAKFTATPAPPRKSSGSPD